jgi:NADPH:quinone reductase-like Zn-dependent oxidoreductase
MLEAGTIRPIIDRRYPLAEAADAMRHVDSGQALGKVVITVPPAEGS